jgi:hypothetical protein
LTLLYLPLSLITLSSFYFLVSHLPNTVSIILYLISRLFSLVSGLSSPVSQLPSPSAFLLSLTLSLVLHHRIYSSLICRLLSFVSRSREKAVSTFRQMFVHNVIWYQDCHPTHFFKLDFTPCCSPVIEKKKYAN